MFSRLELREILNNLNTNTCDEEVVAKLRSLAGAVKLQTISVRDDPPPSFRDPPPSFRDPAGFSIGDPIESHPLIANMRREDYPHLRLADGSFDETSYQALLTARRASIKQDIAKAGAIPMNVMAPPEIHDRRLENVPVGSKNSAGDKCVTVSGGFSVYACPHGHGYMDTNPAAPLGCSTCALEGNVQAGRAAARTEDDTIIPGEEPF
jgi:hypothetical protein